MRGDAEEKVKRLHHLELEALEKRFGSMLTVSSITLCTPVRFLRPAGL